MRIEKMKLAIDDPRCGGSRALAVLGTLVELKGVVSVGINVATESAYVEYDPAVVRPSDLAQAVGEVGLKVGEAASP